MDPTSWISSDENIFDFFIVKLDPLTISIGGDFQFTVEKDIKVKSEDDFLNSFINEVNSQQYDSIVDLFRECVLQYSILMDIDVNEVDHTEIQDENDLHDMKFVDRIRLNNDDFNHDIFLQIFYYLSPAELCRVSRVCKDWYKVAQTQDLWKGLCKGLKNPDLIPWKEIFQISSLEDVWDMGCEVTNLIMINGNKVTSSNTENSVGYRYVLTKIGCAPGEKVVFELLLHASTSGYFVSGMVNENFKKSCKIHKKSYCNDCHNIGRGDQTTWTPIFEPPMRNIQKKPLKFGWIIDRTDMENPSISYHLKCHNFDSGSLHAQVYPEASQKALKTDLVLYPAIAIYFSHVVEIKTCKKLPKK